MHESFLSRDAHCYQLQYTQDPNLSDYNVIFDQYLTADPDEVSVMFDNQTFC